MPQNETATREVIPNRFTNFYKCSPDIWIIISAIAQLERDLIAERVRNGLAAARARGAKIGRERKRNDALIHSLLDAQLSFREIARIAKCSHGSVSASKKEYLAKKVKQKAVQETKIFESEKLELTTETTEACEAIQLAPSDSSAIQPPTDPVSLS